MKGWPSEYLYAIAARVGILPIRRNDATMRWFGSEISVVIVIEGRERSHARHQHGHRMGVAAQAAQEPGHLLVNHRVPGGSVVEVLLLDGGRQLTIEQEIAGLEEIAMLGDLLDRIAAIEQHTFFAIGIGDLRFAA